ncbi:Do family serine endopeptidase [Spirochaeta africana]|uniref:Periplasmic serine protease, Do/DeqQ family n=1 Tax=Spirochaeta africana (strain ATCC 700263 / DSM 8902 / Z-7692) TaxID=889378 RepID=H9UG08_SPIAZ|nr:Do family serine endopeptidase [Spirochaeta africana]AFG36451.1 periplasmic serine protease, Do/DeqQ family [Spirochaeta africana DSM 8902]
MIQTTWKQRFIMLAAVFAVFVAGLVFGAVLLRSGSSNSGPYQQVSGSQEVGGTRIEQSVRPLPEAEDGSFAQVAEQVLPTVVEVSVVAMVEQQSPSNMFEFFFGPRQDQPRREFERPGLGSGVIVRHTGSDVYVLTNNHVVGEADEIEVGLYDGRSYEAELVGGDERTDLALLRFTSTGDIPVADLGSSDDLRVGDWVLAIGNPFGFHSTVTAGIVSATGRRAQQAGAGLPELTDFIQTDAAINPGNSGGALVNMQGEVVGINTWIVGGQTGGSVGLGFAIPMSQAIGAIDQFIEQGRIVYGWLGVSIADASADALPSLAEDLGILDRSGSLILNVYRGAPAAEHGLLPGDYVIGIDDAAIGDTLDFQRVVGSIPPGESRVFRIVRDGSEQTVEITIEERAPEDQLTDAGDIWPGVTVLPLDDDLRRETRIPDSVDGVVVAAVPQNSPAAAAGIRPGDVVTRVDGAEVATAREFYRLLADAGARLELTVARRDAEVDIRLPGL